MQNKEKKYHGNMSRFSKVVAPFLPIHLNKWKCNVTKGSEVRIV
jgi:hypothetical protein